MSALFDPAIFGPLIGVLSSIGTAIYAFMTRRSKAAEDAMEEVKAEISKRALLSDLAALEVRVDETEKKVAQIETEMRHMPDREMVNEIKLAIADLKGTVGQLGERVQGVQRIVNVIDETLRKDSR